MIILEDSRQQVGKHDQKHRWFSENGIEIRRTKLYVGDYSLPTDQSVCIDTKKDFQEIIGNLTGHKKDKNGKTEHDRLVEETERAREAGIRLIYLIENEGGEIKKGKNIYNPVITKLEDVHKWVNPRLFIFEHGKQKYPKATKGITLQKMLYTFSAHHGCEFMFCHPKDAGRIIVELLTEDKETKQE